MAYMIPRDLRGKKHFGSINVSQGSCAVRHRRRWRELIGWQLPRPPRHWKDGLFFSTVKLTTSDSRLNLVHNVGVDDRRLLNHK
jgi:hypothetical protein